MNQKLLYLFIELELTNVGCDTVHFKSNGFSVKF